MNKPQWVGIVFQLLPNCIRKGRCIKGPLCPGKANEESLLGPLSLAADIVDAFSVRQKYLGSPATADQCKTSPHTARFVFYWVGATFHSGVEMKTWAGEGTTPPTKESAGMSSRVLDGDLQVPALAKGAILVGLGFGLQA